MIHQIIGNQFRKPSGLLGKLIAKIMLKGNNRAYKKVIQALEIKPDDKIFEIGYGSGNGVFRIASDYDCFISGIDFSELMFGEATKRNKIHVDNKRVSLHYGDFLNAEIASNQYNTIFCINVIYFWPNLVKPFSKINTILKPGGLFCIYMMHPNDLNKRKFKIVLKNHIGIYYQ